MNGGIHSEIVQHPSAWYGRDLIDDTAWLARLEGEDLAEIDAALKAVQARNLPLGAIGRADFPLPKLGPKLLVHLDSIRTGRGFVVLRGLPVARYTDAEVGVIFWGIGAYLGEPVTQNPQGDLLGHVYDHGRTYGDLDVRGYQTAAHLPFHTDSCDLVGLLCLRAAKSGGLSSVVSAITLHSEILRRRPDLLEPLYRGYHYIRREAANTEEPVTPHRIPVFGAKNGLVSCRLIRNQINAACVKVGRPLEAPELEALDLFDSLSRDPSIHLDMNLQVGDMQLCNNLTMLHSRTDYEDWPEPERKRHMLRLWLVFRERRPLASTFPAHNGYGRNQIAEVALLSAESGHG
jgi:hypothetical protein